VKLVCGFRQKPNHNPMKIKIILSLAVAIVALVLTHSATAVPTVDVLITETSSTSLSATFGGTTLIGQKTAPDRWTLTFPDSFTFGTFTINGWIEPESALGNIVDSPGTNQLFVLSDILIGSTPRPDGSTVFGLPLTLSGLSTTVNITFHDGGDGATVPEKGSTFGLLFVSVVALFGLNRLRHVQLS
jgi:hypothetical protein